MARNKSMKEQLEGIAISVAPIVSKEKKRESKQEGGDVDNQMTIMMSKPMESVPMKSDEQMEDDFIDFVVNSALSSAEQNKLMDTLESDEEVSIIFDKLMSTATEFAGSGPVEGPGSAVSDSIPARLSDGEFVMTAKATEEIGADNLQRMMDDAEAKADDRQNMQEGGEAEEEKDTYGRPIMESDKDEEIKKAMLSANPRLA